MIKNRYLTEAISRLCFAHGKMAFVSGPRQCGKTTLSKQLLAQRKRGQYFNWDEIKFRRLWTKDPTQISAITKTNTSKIRPLIVLDEIHKAKSWKRNLKGVYDTLATPIDILVTGSARLNVYRKGGDSLLGRYHHFRLHPFSLAELLNHCPDDSYETELFSLWDSYPRPTQFAESKKYLELLYRFGPFPEPLFLADTAQLNLWLKGRVEKIAREDLRDLSRLPELSQVEMLMSLLPERAAQILSIQALSEDLEVAYTTIKRWLNYLYELYYAFKIQPYFNRLSHALRKNSKLYLWDWSEIENDGARFENLVACHLLKYCDYLTDTGRGNFQLYYLRNRQHQEIDFLLLKDKKPWLAVETKLHDEQLSPNWKAFTPHLGCEHCVQIVKDNDVYKIRDTEYAKILVISASQFLSYLV